MNVCMPAHALHALAVVCVYACTTLKTKRRSAVPGGPTPPAAQIATSCTPEEQTMRC